MADANSQAPEAINADDPLVITDRDRDALDVLPLSIVPFQSANLRQTRLIKNARLEGMLEVFSGRQTGSGQISITDARQQYQLTGGGGKDSDLSVLRELSRLSSYDIYSLRILLRRHGITVEDYDVLKLSETKNEELSNYMRGFTYPLIQKIYGDDSKDIQNFRDILKLFRHPDVKKARDRLQQMADMLHIKVDEIPAFLEDYGDIFLSLSYYRQCLEDIKPLIGEVLDFIDKIIASPQLKHNRELIKTCINLKTTISNVVRAIMRLFKQFDENTHDMWDGLSEESFREVEALIRKYHIAIGGALCALTVKMNAWHRLFPNRYEQGLNRRAEFIMTDMVQGMESIKKLEAQLTGKKSAFRETAYAQPQVLVAPDLKEEDKKAADKADKADKAAADQDSTTPAANS